MDTPTVDLPPIDEGLLQARPGPIVVLEPENKQDLAKVDLTAAALARFGDWKTDVAAARTKLTGLVLDLSTQAKVDEAKSLRHRLIGQPRAEVRKVSKALKSALAQTSKAIGAEEEAAVAAYDDAETLISPQIDARQAELDAEREAKAAKERERVAALDAKLAGFSAWIDRCKEPGITAERIAVGIKMLNELDLDKADWEEFLGRALVRRAEVIEVMRQIHRDTLAAEMRAAELERQRVENERVAADLAERQRLLDEQAAEVRRREEQLNSQRQVSGAQTDPNATGNGNMAQNTDDAAPVGGLAEGEGAAALSPGTAEREPKGDAGTQELPPPGGPASAENHTQESGSCAGTPATCASNAADSATAAPSGEEGPAAHADDSAADPDGLPLETSEREAQPPGCLPPGAIVGQVPLDTSRIVYFQAGPEPDEDDEGGIDLLTECLSLIELLRKPYAGRFPSHPKPGPEWWSEVRNRIDLLEPKIVMAAAIKRGA